MGADPEVRDDHGQSARDLARRKAVETMLEVT
jgi:hypothetical protein